MYVGTTINKEPVCLTWLNMLWYLIKTYQSILVCVKGDNSYKSNQSSFGIILAVYLIYLILKFWYGLQVTELKSSNLKLSKNLEEAMDRYEILASQKTDLENRIESDQVMWIMRFQRYGRL